jgi:uncharacterized coiled-coil protein SlyX
VNEERIIGLETRLTYMEELLDQLNRDAVARQQRERELELKIEQLNSKVADLLELAGEEREAAQRPPHY